MTETMNTQAEIDRATDWYGAATGGSFNRPASADDEGKGAPHTSAHPLATVGAIVHTAQRTNVMADILAGTLLAEAGDDAGAVHYLSQVFVDRAYNDYGRTLRAAHTMFHADQMAGDEDKSLLNVPDGYTRVQSSSVQRRSNTGTSYREVKIHGRSYVGGSYVATPNRGASMSVERIAYALETAPRTALGHVDGIAINRLVDVLYPDLPRLSGADTVSWSDFAAWDAVRAATPRKPKPRYSLPRVPAGEYAARPHELISYRDETTVWIGHRVAERIASYRDKRAARARSVTEAFTVSSVTDLPTLLEMATTGHDGRGRWTWNVDGTDTHGVFTLSASGRIGVTGSGIKVAAAKTIGAAQKALALQLATLA